MSKPGIFQLSSNASVAANRTAKMIPAYDDSLERIFVAGNVSNVGIDKAGFVVFDRGSGTTHDPFYVAAIRSLDASGNPSSYYNAVSVIPGFRQQYRPLAELSYSSQKPCGCKSAADGYRVEGSGLFYAIDLKKLYNLAFRFRL